MSLAAIFAIAVAGGKTAMVNAANALYPGGPEAAIVAEAWTKVGV